MGASGLMSLTTHSQGLIGAHSMQGSWNPSLSQPTWPPTGLPGGLHAGAMKSRPQPILVLEACSLGNRCPPLSLPDCGSVNPGGPSAPLCGLSSLPPSTLGSNELKRDNIWVSPGPQWPSCLLGQQPQEQLSLPPGRCHPALHHLNAWHPLRQGPQLGPLSLPRYFVQERALGAWPMETPTQSHNCSYYCGCSSKVFATSVPRPTGPAQPQTERHSTLSLGG